MKQIYRVTVRGRTLESADVRMLLARAVREKRALDRAFRYSAAPQAPGCSGGLPVSGAEPVVEAR